MSYTLRRERWYFSKSNIGGIVNAEDIPLLREQGAFAAFDPDYTQPIFILSAFNEQGQLIGNKKLAKFLCGTLGINPEYRTPTARICTIGKSVKDGKWYGWSHRAYHGFAVGDKITANGWMGKELHLTEDLHLSNEDLARSAACAFASFVS